MGSAAIVFIQPPISLGLMTASKRRSRSAFGVFTVALGAPSELEPNSVAKSSEPAEIPRLIPPSMIGNIRTACEEETESSKMIVKSMENIQHSSDTTVEASRVMDGAVAGLSDQVKLLQQKMAGLTA